MTDIPEVMTAEQAAAYLNVSPKSVQRRMDRKSIPFVKVGRLRRLRKSDLDLWLDRNSIHA